VFLINNITTKAGRHDIAEILLKVALNTINQIKSNRQISGTNNFIAKIFTFGKGVLKT
jgi:hypothetical protein